MNYLEQIELAVNHDFVTKVQQAALDAAIMIANEGASDKSSVDAKRLAYAQLVLNSPKLYAQTMAYGIVTFIDGQSDEEVATAVANVWNAYAGVNPNLLAKDAVLSAAARKARKAAPIPAPEKIPWYKKMFK